MNTKRRFQFSTSTLLGVTSIAALLIVLLPLACRVYVEIVSLSALFLCLLTALADQALPLRTSYIRRSLTVLLAIASTGLTVHALRGKIDLFPIALVPTTIFISCLRPAKVNCGGYRIAWSSIGCVVLFACFAFQFYRTDGQRYFVNRCLAHGYDSATVEQDGVIGYRLAYDGLRTWRRDGPLEVETLFDALDIDSFHRPVTKCRLLCGSDSIFHLSFAYSTQPTDWSKLRSQSQLTCINFDFLRISSEQIDSLEPLTKLDQLAFFSCELPSEFLRRSRHAKNLLILQVVDCKIHDLVGISAFKKLRKLILYKTKLSQSELDEISMLYFLKELDLRDTQLTEDDFAFLAAKFKASSSMRRGALRCVVTYDAKLAKGLAALLESGAISELALADFASSEEDLQFLRSVDTSVSIAPLQTEEGGTKP